MKRIFLCLAVILGLLTACSDDDSFTTSRNNLLTFATDTVKMDTVFSNVASSTYSLWVFNNSGDGLRIKTVRLRNANQTGFRVNVDGSYLDNTAGSVATDLEVRKGDSIRVYIELTAPENHLSVAQPVEDDLLFTLESGAEQRVHLQSYAWDAVSLRSLVVHNDTVIESNKPLVVYGDGISVDSGAVLTIRHTTLYFHDGAGMKIRGTLLTDSVVMRGDRLDHMFSYLPYDRVSGQWLGLSFDTTSVGNVLKSTEIRNAMTAVLVQSRDTTVFHDAPQLTMNRCIVHNAKGDGVVSFGSRVVLSYCQLTNTLGDCLAINGGRADIDHCTLAQFYPLSAQRGAALYFNAAEGLQLECSNSIVTGYNADVVMGEHPDTTYVSQYRFNNCLLRTPEVPGDTVSFKNIHWEKEDDEIQGKKHFRLIDERNMIYDFRLDSLSTAKGKGCY
jgi:hypothetical protein